MKLSNYFIIWHNYFGRLAKKTAMTYKQRQKIYRMLEKMTAEPAVLQINEALAELKMLEARGELKSRLWYVYDDIMEQMRSSEADFAHALAKYVPQQDTMIIAASEQDDITLGFTTVIENNRKTNEMKQAFTQALAYPILMVCVLVTLLFYFSIKVIPAFMESMQSGVVLSSSSVFLVEMAQSFNWWFSLLVIGIVGVGLFIVWALPNLTHKYRKFLEDLPPFNMYRIMIGCGFLFALNSLSKSGYLQYEALEQMLKLAKPYLRYRIELLMDKMADGLDIGEALIYSKLNFPDKQMVRELAIQIKYSDEDTLEVLSSNLAEDGLEIIKIQAQIMRFLITFIVFGVIAFLYFAVYQFGSDLANVK
ncbi:MAG: type II secretion system F family protein [Burkholderiales bacterium]|nr:type II secretion system F family protein [Burkholderiales bacterium]